MGPDHVSRGQLGIRQERQGPDGGGTLGGKMVGWEHLGWDGAWGWDIRQRMGFQTGDGRDKGWGSRQGKKTSGSEY